MTPPMWLQSRKGSNGDGRALGTPMVYSDSLSTVSPGVGHKVAAETHIPHRLVRGEHLIRSWKVQSPCVEGQIKSQMSGCLQRVGDIPRGTQCPSHWVPDLAFVFEAQEVDELPTLPPPHNQDIDCSIEHIPGLKQSQRGPQLHITQAFRLGRANNLARTLPRDIIVTFADIKVKNKILDIAHDKGFLMHKNDHICFSGPYPWKELKETPEKKRTQGDYLNSTGCKHAIQMGNSA